MDVIKVDINECFMILELGYQSLDKLDEHYKMIGEEHRGDLNYLMRLKEAYDTLKSGNYDVSSIDILRINRYAIKCKEERLARKPHQDGEMEAMAKKVLLDEAVKFFNNNQLNYFKNILAKDEFVFTNINNYRALFTIVKNINDGIDVDRLRMYLKAGAGDINYKFLLNHIEYITNNQDIINIFYELSGVEEIKVVNKM